MTTVQKPPLTIGITDEIRQEPKLLEAVEAASRQLEEFLHAEKFEFERYAINWSRNRQTPSEISADYTEWDHYGDRQAKISIPVSRLYDPVLRNSALTDLRLEALGKMSRQIGKSMDKKLAILREEERRNGDE